MFSLQLVAIEQTLKSNVENKDKKTLISCARGKIKAPILLFLVFSSSIQKNIIDITPKTSDNTI